MTGIGTVSAAEMFSEQVELKGRTTDPANAKVGEYWVRVDQTSSNPEVVAELRRQDTSGVTKIPLFADSEEANLGNNVVRGPSVVLDDGSAGFVAMASDPGAKFGSPRVVTAAGTEYLSHDSLTIKIYDNAVYRWPHKTGSGSTLTDTLSTNDGSITGASWVSGTWFDSYALDYDGNGDKVEFSTVPEIDTNNNFSVAFSIEAPKPSKDKRIMEHYDGNGFGFLHNNGEFGVGAYDGSSFLDTVSGSISANTKTRIFYVWDGSTNSSTLYLNATQVTNSNVGNISTTSGFTLGTFNNDYNPFDGITDDLLIMDAAEGAQTAQYDYNRQPWS